jgi:hypothetical protein
MGTAATERSAERPGDGASPGACAVDQITPERPEERQCGGAGPRFAALSRTGKSKSRGPNGGCLLRRATRVVPRGDGKPCLVPLAELIR